VWVVFENEMSTNTDCSDGTDEWTFGDSCPHCGATTVTYLEKIARTLVPGDDGEVVDTGLHYAEGIEVACGECDAHLGSAIDAETVNR